MGPIKDQLGLEQGGINGSDLYTIFAMSKLQMSQDSKLGVKMSDIVVSAIGQADDVVALSNDINDLKLLLELNIYFCEKYHIDYCPDKIHLQVYSTNLMSDRVNYDRLTHNLMIGGKELEFCETAEHVGVERSVNGNLPHIMSRFAAHNKALQSVLHTGLSLRQRGNPVASLKVEGLYGSPVLLSGLGSLVLSNKEIDLINTHHKQIIQSLLRLYQKTPRCVVYFLSGSLPAEALIHMRQFSLLSMISRQPESILYRHAMNTYANSKPSSKSWFIQVRDLCLFYGLPHPIYLLQHPLSKPRFKYLVKSKVINCWKILLRK